MTGIRRAAFFDVDETLITAKSMFEFMRHWFGVNGDDGTLYRERAGALREMAARGLPREEGNRAYYRNFAGASREKVRAEGRSWYATYREGPEAFVGASLSALAGHRRAGDQVVLVSGSFDACLQPLAEEVGADLVLCSQPLVADDGTYTGDVERSMIGSAKAAAVARTIADLAVDAGDCFGYGDHASDADMLEALGHPVVVGADPVLNERARKRGWRVLPATGVGKETNEAIRQ